MKWLAIITGFLTLLNPGCVFMAVYLTSVYGSQSLALSLPACAFIIYWNVKLNIWIEDRVFYSMHTYIGVDPDPHYTGLGYHKWRVVKTGEEISTTQKPKWQEDG